MKSLKRFKDAQSKDYVLAYYEIKVAQKKETHWIWYIFPQLEGLGYSSMAQYYGLKNLKEAKKYYKNKRLRENLIGISKALLDIEGKDIVDIVGPIDAKKIQSCMTLFLEVDRGNEVFKGIIDKYYDGELDENTLYLL